VLSVGRKGDKGFGAAGDLENGTGVEINSRHHGSPEHYEALAGTLVVEEMRVTGKNVWMRSLLVS
jgi:hypothetical protein